MSVRRAAILFGLLFYIVLWFLFFDGATTLGEPLVVPLVLVAMIALGVAFNRFMGLPARQQPFRDRDDGPQP